MDFLRIFILCIASITLLHTANAGCKEDIENNNDFMECKDAYIKYLAREADIHDAYIKYLAREADIHDLTAILDALCWKEGQAVTNCLRPYIEACNDLMSDRMLGVFGINKDGCYSAIGGEGGPSTECQAALGECMGTHMRGNTAGDTDMENAPTKFHDFKEAIKTICGGVNGLFDCFTKHEKKCPEIESLYKEMYEMGRRRSTANGEPFPEFGDRKKFALDECPKFPADFATNTCVKESLLQKEFTDCYKNATEQSGEQMRCDEYQAAYPCVTTALQNCGDKHKSTFTTTTNFYLSALFDDCKIVEKKEPTSSANVYTTSFSTILVSIFMTFSALIV